MKPCLETPTEVCPSGMSKADNQWYSSCIMVPVFDRIGTGTSIEINFQDCRKQLESNHLYITTFKIDWTQVDLWLTQLQLPILTTFTHTRSALTRQMLTMAKILMICNMNWTSTRPLISCMADHDQATRSASDGTLLLSLKKMTIRWVLLEHETLLYDAHAWYRQKTAPGLQIFNWTTRSE